MKKIAFYPNINEDGIGTYISNLEKFIPCTRINSDHDLLSIKQFFSSIPRGFEIVHVPNFLVPLITKGPKIVTTIQDIIPVKFYGKRKPLEGMYFKFRIFWSLIMSDHIIFTSHSTMNDVKELFFEPKSYSIIPLGITKATSLDTTYDRYPKFYFLCVGRRREHKNTHRIIDAFYEFNKKNSDFYLIFTGSPDKYDSNYLKKIYDYQLSEKIIFTGLLNNNELSILYKNAYALLYPSLYEGFGLPILEAMAHGCPVITSCITSMPEVAGDAAVTIDPYNVQEIINAMNSVLNVEFRKNLIDKGMLRVDLFKWENTAKLTQSVYDKLIGGNL